MRSAPRALFFAPATLAVTLSLPACVADVPSGSPVGAPSATSEAGLTSAPVLPPSPAPAPAPAGMVTYSFPDGRLSFAHPAGWRVQHEQVSSSPSVEIATVLDEGGKQQINIYYSQIGDAQAGPAERYVLETDPVPGLAGQSVPTPHASFFVDHINGAVQYRMGLTSGLPVSPDGKVHTGPVLLGRRVLAADVLFAGAPFADDRAAKAWYWSGEGQALKAVLVSFSYR